MSGGLDSSATALILKNQGFEVIGLTLQFFENNLSSAGNDFSDNIKDINSARKFADLIDIPHFIVDVNKHFKQTIIDDFILQYKTGFTPNPCAKCNPEIKWKYLYEISQKLDCEFIATGHYANIKEKNRRYFLNLPDDKTKDQSMFLWKLPQKILKKAIFPLSAYSKDEIRKMMSKNGYNFITERRESFNLCFIKKMSNHDFLKKHIKNVEQGQVFSSSGKYLGVHNGYFYYTIGQKVENIDMNLRVRKIIAETNTIIVDNAENIITNELIIDNINLMKYKELQDGFSVNAKIKYRENGNNCKIFNFENKLKLIFENYIPKPAVGQSVVLFEGNDMLGGGIITNTN